jgi:sugar (pentulose or hexulose) kinase
LRAGTFAIDWFIKNILNIDPSKRPGVYAQLEAEAGRTPAGSGGLLYLPYLCGAMNPHWDADARGAWTGLSSSHGRGHMYRSILEGIAFEQRFALNAVEEIIGLRVREVAAIGGGAASALWRQIMADVTGKDICVPDHVEASALGAGIAAAVGAGWYPTFKTAAKQMTGEEKKIKPDRRTRGKYLGLYAAYREIYPGLKKANSLLSRRRPS